MSRGGAPPVMNAPARGPSEHARPLAPSSPPMSAEPQRVSRGPSAITARTAEAEVAVGGRDRAPWGRAGLALCVFVVAVLGAAVAVAQATVEVEVRTAGERAEGRVTLVSRSDGGPSYTCDTRGGRCTMRAVAGGRYTVRFVPTRGDAPPERTVVIPPSGDVSLIVGSGG